MTANPNTESKSSPIPWPRIIWCQGILLAALGLMFPLVAYVGWTKSEQAGLIAATVAFLICWLPNAAALAMIGILNDPQNSVQIVLGGMLLRMGLPLGTVILLMQSRHWLVDAHFAPMVLAFYLVALAVETLLSLWTLGGSRTPVGKVS